MDEDKAVSAKRDYYLETLHRMEPDIAMVDAGAGWASVAVFLKRIADALDRVATVSGIVEMLPAIQRAVENMEDGRG